MSFRRVGVIGLGLVGGSVGAALRRHGVKVRGFDTEPRHLRIGLERGLIDAAAQSVAEAVDAADVVVLAVPGRAIVELLPVVDSLAPVEGLLIDTGSVKGAVVDAMSRLRGAFRAIGGHPIAGKELSGPGRADGALFAQHPFVLTPSPATAQATVEKAQRLVRLVGAEPVLMAPADHDRILARTSHLPQLLSSTLALTLSPADLPLAGSGLRDMTRLAASDVTMWRDILLANRGEVAGAARNYIARLDGLIRMVESGDSGQLERTLEEGRWAAEPLRGDGI